MAIKLLKETRALAVPGFSSSGIISGIKKVKKKDLALILSDREASVAGVFTTNMAKAAPVILDIERVKCGKSRGVIINSGSANVSVGRRGMKDAKKMTTMTEQALSLKEGEILVCSTGVIGQPLPMDKIEAGITPLTEKLKDGVWKDASEAIMTTDSSPKTKAVRAKVGGEVITIQGIAKGAGMICPDMATMLAFVMTDAKITPALLKKALKTSVDWSFNRITVDGDTSTNDTVLAFANGASGKAIKANTQAYSDFLELLGIVTLDLAHKIVKDGEGGTKFVEIIVKGARTKAEAERGVRTVGNSLLVKTALYGEDPNWGRIIAAIGRAGIVVNGERLDIFFDNICVVRRGVDAGNEKKAARVLKKKEFKVTINLNAGKGEYNLWTSDIGHEYIKINSEYTS